MTKLNEVDAETPFGSDAVTVILYGLPWTMAMFVFCYTVNTIDVGLNVMRVLSRACDDE